MKSRREQSILPVIVIGAGPAGLAVGACLSKAGTPFVILEQANAPGAAWHSHYDRLHLHSDKAHSALPFVPFPADYPRYPSRAQFISYLERYARKLGLQPKFNQRVKAVRRGKDAWTVETQNARYRGGSVVVATGCNRGPYAPKWPGQASFRGLMLHSSRYRTGEAFRGKQVLVVGFGNSGAEIALDLWEHGARPTISVRGPVSVIPREVLGLPVLALALLLDKLPSRLADALNAPIIRAAFGDLGRYGLQRLPAGPITHVRTHARLPVIDVGVMRLIREGKVEIRPGVAGFNRAGVTFMDGEKRKLDAVILATGYRPGVDELLKGIPAACDGGGYPASSGRQAALPGLYFCGFHITPTGLLREIGLEARGITEAISLSLRQR